jgi:hypothetical protein
MVDIRCPVCHEVRPLSAKTVRYQLRKGIFTGRCSKDRLVSHLRSDSPDLPDAEYIDWDDRVLVDEAGGRRRSRVRVVCHECGTERLIHPHYLRLQVLAGTFRPECSAHRRGAAAAERATSKPAPAQPRRPENSESIPPPFYADTRKLLFAHLRKDVDSQIGELLDDISRQESGAAPSPRARTHRRRAAGQ